MTEADNENNENNENKKCLFQNPYIKYGTIGAAIVGVGGCLYYYFKK